MQHTAEDVQKLRELLAQAEARADKAEKRAGKAERRADKAESRADKAENRAEKAEKRLAETEVKLVKAEARAKLAVNVTSATAAICLETIERAKEAGVDIPEAQRDQLKTILGEYAYIDGCARNSTQLLEYLLSKGTEQSNGLFSRLLTPQTAKESETAAEQTQKAVASEVVNIANGQKKADAVISVLETAAGEAAALQQNAEKKNEALDACGRIAKITPPKREVSKPVLKGDKKTLGRRPVKQREEAVTLLNSAWRGLCPQCGGEFTTLGSYTAFMRDMKGAVNSLFRAIKYECTLLMCSNSKCGRIHVQRPEGVPMPVSIRQGTIGQPLAVELGVLLAAGIPGNKIEKQFGALQDDLQLGTDTLMRNVNRWTQEGAGKYLLERIKAKGSENNIIEFDETPFDVQQLTGRSVKKLEGSARQGYVLAASSVPGQDFQFSVYTSLRGRSAAEIKAKLLPWRPEKIVTDGYAGYTSIMNSLEGTKDKISGRQVCLVHLRRKVLAALDADDISEVIVGPDGASAAKQRFAKGCPQFLLCMIVDGFRKLYTAEASVVRSAGESYGTFLGRVKTMREEYSRPLMNDIDRIFRELARENAAMDKGKWIKLRDSNLAEAVVFYLNNEKEMKAFLDDAGLPPDTNACEQTIRAAVVCKRASNFKQSPDFLEGLCGWLSLVETGRKCGIRNIQKWLTDYGEAFMAHCESMTLTQKYLEGRFDMRHPRLDRLEPEAIESFDMTPWMPDEYARREREGKA